MVRVQYSSAGHPLMSSKKFLCLISVVFEAGRDCSLKASEVDLSRASILQ